MKKCYRAGHKEVISIQPEHRTPMITLEATLDCHDVIGRTARARVKSALAEAKTRLAIPAE